MGRVKLRVLTPTQHEFLRDKDPTGFYDQSTREILRNLLAKLNDFRKDCTRAESRLAKAFRQVEPGLLLPETMDSKGSIHTTGPICIEGQHEGDVTTDGILILTETGRLTGNANVKALYCKGKMIGEVHARQKVKVYPTGMIVGNVEALSIQVETGALFKGHCRLNPDVSGELDELMPRKKSVVGQLFGVGFLGLR